MSMHPSLQVQIWSTAGVPYKSVAYFNFSLWRLSLANLLRYIKNLHLPKSSKTSFWTCLFLSYLYWEINNLLICFRESALTHDIKWGLPQDWHMTLMEALLIYSLNQVSMMLMPRGKAEGGNKSGFASVCLDSFQLAKIRCHLQNETPSTHS